MTTTTTTKTAVEEFIAGRPKCELHVHLEGTLSPELKLVLAPRNNIALAQTTVAEVQATYQFDSLSSFLAIYYPAMNIASTLCHQCDTR